MQKQFEAIQAALEPFRRTSLDAMSELALLRRFDSKFVVPESWIPQILNGLQGSCSLLEVEGESITHYENLYFEWPEDGCLVDHLRGKGHRYKIRARSYSSSGVAFLEVKERMHNGRTLKHRVQRAEASVDPVLSAAERAFLKEALPHDRTLAPALTSSFERITLADFERGERVTIDRLLKFEDAAGRRSDMHSLAVIELKQPRKTRNTPLHDVLKSWPSQERHGILGRSTRVSKYTVARLMCDPDLRRRTYGTTLRDLELALRYLHRVIPPNLKHNKNGA
jgi:hypothetical protein